MSYPFFQPFKTRTIDAATTSTGSQLLTCVVPARGKIISAQLSVGYNQSQTAAATVDFELHAGALGSTAGSLPSTIAGMGGLSVTTTTAATFLFAATTATYVNQGDVLVLSSTGTCCPQVMWVIQEF